MALVTVASVALRTDLSLTTPPFDKHAVNDIASLILFESGSGVGQADLSYVATRSVAPSSVDSVDIFGALTDPLGVTVSMVKLKLLYIMPRDTNAASMSLAKLSNAVPLFSSGSGSITINRGGLFLWASGSANAAGLPVTPTTGDLVSMINNSASTTANYSIIAVGTSA